jgi:type I restriction enzyme S subunit
MVRFGDVVQHMGESERNPVEAGLNRVVGLEHIDSDDLHIKRWASLAEGTSFTKRFRKGQVLFGRRRAYLRKVAYAEFDGICSGDITVLQPKDDNLLPELLPFLLQTDGFLDYVLSVSAGGLSPRARWRDLAKYEFPLPPKPEQRRIAEILWAAERATQGLVASLDRLASLERSATAALAAHGRNVRWTPLGDVVGLCQYGLSIRGESSGEYPMLRMQNIVGGAVVASDLQYVNLAPATFEKFKLVDGDIVFNRTNSFDLVGKVGIFHHPGNYVFASYLVRIRATGDVMLPDYLNYYLNSAVGQRRIRAHASPGVSQTNINASNLRKVLVPVVPLKVQASIVESLQSIESVSLKVQEHQLRLATMANDLLRSLLHSGSAHVH